jgi:hypothetical protein
MFVNSNSSLYFRRHDIRRAPTTIGQITIAQPKGTHFCVRHFISLISYCFIFRDDILRAIDKLKVLGSGFELIALGGGRYLVQSVPGELNMDHTRVLQLAEVEDTIVYSLLHFISFRTLHT